jgi:hypothetical protein
MSYIKNVQAFGKLTGICTGYGGRYNPGQQNLQLSSMLTLLSKARQVMDEINAAQTEYDNVTNSRELAFIGVRKLSTRVISVLQSCGAHKLTIEDARVRIRKLWGVRTADRSPLPSEKDGQPIVKSRTARGLDYGTLAEHIAKLLETVSAEANYQPNEPELTVEGLGNTLATLRSLNEAVIQSTVRLSNVRKKRNALLHESEVNVCRTALAAKFYIKAAFGPDSEQYNEVTRLRFTKPTA